MQVIETIRNLFGIITDMHQKDHFQSKRSKDGKQFEDRVRADLSGLLGSKLGVEVYGRGNMPEVVKDMLRTPHPEERGVMVEHDCDVVMVGYKNVVIFHCRSNLDEVQKPMIAMHEMKKYAPTSSHYHFIATLDKGRNGSSGHLSKDVYGNRHGRTYSYDYAGVYSWRDDVFETPAITPSGSFSTQIVRSYKRLWGDIVSPMLSGKFNLEDLRQHLISEARDGTSVSVDIGLVVLPNLSSILYGEEEF